MPDPIPLAIRLTIAEAHGEVWALFVRHLDGVVELHKTDTYKRLVAADTVADERASFEDEILLVADDPVSCLQAVEADVELLCACPLCRAAYDVN